MHINSYFWSAGRWRDNRSRFMSPVWMISAVSCAVALPRRAAVGLLLSLSLLLGACSLTPANAASTSAASTSGVAHLPRIQIAPDGHGFVTAQGKPFVPMGVSYYRPDTGWAPQVWKQFDPAATRRDFARLKALGANCVRVFLTYGSFYQKPGVLSPVGLAKFDEFLKLAEAAGLYVQVTGPAGWEGMPSWARGDRFADERLLRAQVDFWKLFAARYRHRSIIFAYGLANEPSIHWRSEAMQAKWDIWTKRHYGSLAGAYQAWHLTPPTPMPAHAPVPGKHAGPSRQLLDYQHFREGLADVWTQRQVKAIKSVDPDALVTIGLVQYSVPMRMPRSSKYPAFRPSELARYLDFMEIHFYPLATGFYAYGGAEDEARNLALLEGIVSQVAACGKPTVLAEFGWYGGGKLTLDGGKYPAATQAQQARWCRRAVETTEGLACGWLNWGLYDCPAAKDVSQLTGLLKPDGKVKAWGRTFEQLAKQFRKHPPQPRRLGSRPTVDWDRCITDPKARARYREQYYRAYLADSHRP